MLLAFHKVGDAIRAKASQQHPVPFKRLVEFERVSLQPGASTTVAFAVPTKRLYLTNADGDYALYAGDHSIVFSRGNSADDVEVPVTVAAADLHKNLHPDF